MKTSLPSFSTRQVQFIIASSAKANEMGIMLEY